MHVRICDVGPRDGLQNLDRILAPADRANLVERLVQAGVRDVEAASFVNPQRVPQMAGAEEVAHAINRRAEVTYSGLVLNERGYDRLRTTALDEVHLAVAATETFNRRNQGVSIDLSLAHIAAVIERAHTDGRTASATVAVAFGCPFEGTVPPTKVVEIAERLVASGTDAVMVADTIGVGVPRQVRLFARALGDTGVSLGVHLHNTRNTAIANAYAALEEGVKLFDASIGGLGGCPFAPHASGNIATEDLVYLLDGERVDTGISLERLLEVSAWLETRVQKPLESQVYRAAGARLAPA